ncbi:MAG: hypothetical protein N3I35_17165 [Clostridia bacterium]|nr:hypothetical protein [Clostridia bacterium]
MKKLIFCLLLLPAILSACNTGYLTRMPDGQDFVRLQTEQIDSRDGIKILSAKKEVKAGEKVEFTVQGKAGAEYEIASTYVLDSKTYTAYQSKTADKEGTVSWSWRVNEKTKPGTYAITITGDGTTLLSSYTVTK